MASFLSTWDLKTFRQSFQLFNDATTPYLYQTLLVKANNEFHKRCACTLNNPPLQASVRCSVVETLPDFNFCSRDPNHNNDDWEVDQDVDNKRVVKALTSYLPQMVTFEMHFSHDVGNRRNLDNVMETAETRSEWLHTLFRTLAHRVKSNKVRVVEDLTIVHLSNFLHYNLVSSGRFKKAMRVLK